MARKRKREIPIAGGIGTVGKPSSTNRMQTRPRTRGYVQHLQEEEEKEKRPRRSNRNHHVSCKSEGKWITNADGKFSCLLTSLDSCHSLFDQSIRLKGAAPFYRKLKLLFFSPVSKQDLTTVNTQRQQLRRIHKVPHIYAIDNFLKESELDYFATFIQTCPFQRSFVDNMQYESANTSDKESRRKRQCRTILDSTHRTSTFFGFKHRADSTIRAIEQRTADLLGCWVHQIEGLQLVRYLPGQFFGVHHDLGDLLDTDEVELPPKRLMLKRRLVTLFVYLNDLQPCQGGCTYFPKCGDLRVLPKKGRAILWSNVNSEGFPDSRTIHAGEPVDSPSDKTIIKYGLNIWITEE